MLRNKAQTPTRRFGDFMTPAAMASTAAASTLYLGRGVNIAPFAVRYSRVEAADLQGLASRGVQHVRICGWIAEALADWRTCPASSRPMPSDELSATSSVITGGIGVPDDQAPRAFANLKQLTRDALDAGLAIVLNPFHQRQLVEVNVETVRWIWTAVLQEFGEREFPPDRVAFEMVNEPANYTHSHVAARPPWAQIVQRWVEQVRRRQKNRVLVLTGVQGWLRGHPPAVSSMDGLLTAVSEGLVPAALCAGRCLVTFHYYEPRSFTTRPPPAGSSPPMWTSDGSDLERKLEVMTLAFQRVVNATASIGAGVYLGEFGVVPSTVDAAQGALWLLSVRKAAQKAAFVGYCVWDYYGTKNGLVPEMAGATWQQRLCMWDRSVLAGAALGLAEALEAPSSCQGVHWPPYPPSLSPPMNVAMLSAERPCAADGDVRPRWADALLSSSSQQTSVEAATASISSRTVLDAIGLVISGLAVTLVAVVVAASSAKVMTLWDSRRDDL